MKLVTLIESETAISNLIKEKLPFSVAMDLREFVLNASKYTQSFHETKNAKIVELGVEIEPNKFQIQSQENIETYNKEISEVLDKEIEISIPTISRTHLEKAEISTQDLITLNWLIQ